MTEDFRERFYIKLRYLNRPDCECVSDLMDFYLFQSVPFQETGEELPISTRLCRLCFAGQEVVVRVIRVELLDMNCCSRAASLWYAISSSPILEDHFWLPSDPHFILSRLLSDITDSFSSYFQCHIAIIRNGHLHRFQILVHKLFLFRRTHFNSSRS